MKMAMTFRAKPKFRTTPSICQSSSIIKQRFQNLHFNNATQVFKQQYNIKQRFFCSEQPLNTEEKDPNHIFITTPIFYVNGPPHLGHAYTAVIADTLARWFRLKGKNVLFTTGTDEHGLKIQQTTERIKLAPLIHCNRTSLLFRELFNKLEISYDDFIRTTEDRHFDAVEHFWNHLLEKGELVEGTYSGWYCTSDEQFLSEDEIEEIKDENNNVISRISRLSGRAVDWVEERNIKFPLTKYKDQLLEWITSSSPISPRERLCEVEKEISQISMSLSVSRSSDRVRWGIRCPSFPDQTIYVWLDALVNYLTVAGYPNPNWRKFWPPDYQIIGKDITRFHGIYWPAFLFAAGEKPPKQIVAHAHWTINRKKISKSDGEVIDPLTLISRPKLFTAEEFRYFLVREGGMVDDSDFSEEQFMNRITNDLSNQFGNLISRITSFRLNPSRSYPNNVLANFEIDEKEQHLITRLQTILDDVTTHYEAVQFQRAIEDIMSLIRDANEYMTANAPWAEENEAFRPKVMYILYEIIRVTSILLLPILPISNKRLLAHFNIPENEQSTEYARFSKSDQSICGKQFQDGKIVLFPKYELRQKKKKN